MQYYIMNLTKDEPYKRYPPTVTFFSDKDEAEREARWLERFSTQQEQFKVFANVLVELYA